MTVQGRFPADVKMSETEFLNYLYNFKLEKCGHPLKIAIEGCLYNKKTLHKPWDPVEFKVITTEVESTLMVRPEGEVYKYLIKTYSSAEDYEHDKNNIKEINAKIKNRNYKFADEKDITIFPAFLGAFDDRKIIIMEENRKSLTLEDSLENQDLGAVYWANVSYASDPLILLHDGLDIVNNKSENISLNSLFLNRFDKAERGTYAKKIAELLKEMLGDNLGEIPLIFEDSFLDDEFLTVIQEKPLPSINAFRYIYPTNLAVGSRGFNLGGVFGYESVYNKLRNKEDSIKIIIDNYCVKRELFYDEMRVREYKKIDKAGQEKLLDHFYKGAIIRNLEEYHEIKEGLFMFPIESRNFAESSLNRLMDTARYQFKILAEITENKKIKSLERII